MPPVGYLPPRMRAVELRNWFQKGYKRLNEAHRFEMEDLSDVDLRRKDLSGCDFTGAVFGVGQDFSESVFTGCTFGPPRDGLKPVNLIKVNMFRCVLRDATLQNVSLVDCNLAGADLTNADLSESDCTLTDFSDATMFGVVLTNTNLFQARFRGTYLTLKKQPILQANSKAWDRWCKDHCKDSRESERLEQAAAIYLELKGNFRSIGAYSEASWAYVQERRMRRSQHNPFVARQCFEFDYPNRWGARMVFYLRHFFVWFLDAVIDVTTGYGESLLKTTLTLLVSVTVIFPLLYGLSSGVKLAAAAGAVSSQISRNYLHLLLFSIGNLVGGYPGLDAATEIGKQIQITQQLLGAMMMGLIGFILGKKINQS